MLTIPQVFHSDIVGGNTILKSQVFLKIQCLVPFFTRTISSLTFSISAVWRKQGRDGMLIWLRFSWVSEIHIIQGWSGRGIKGKGPWESPHKQLILQIGDKSPWENDSTEIMKSKLKNIYFLKPMCTGRMTQTVSIDNVFFSRKMFVLS